MIGQIASRLFMRGLTGCARTTHLPITADAAMAQDFLQDLDILYVGGGTTTAMLSHWRKSGIADLLLAAIRQGLVASGVSAGAICWFSDLLLKTEDDCFEPQFEHVRGLGLLREAPARISAASQPENRPLKRRLPVGNYNQESPLMMVLACILSMVLLPRLCALAAAGRLIC